MTFTLALLGLTLAISFCVLSVSVLNAPEGYENDAGFHSGRIEGDNVYGAAVNQPQELPSFAKTAVRRLAA